MNDHLNNCDWDSAAILDGKPKKVVWQQALAWCLKDSKDHREGKFDDAVEAATKAVAHDAINAITARCVRAYAYYLNANYEQAIAECRSIIQGMEEGEISQAKDFAHELLAILYGKLDEPLKVNEYCRKVFKRPSTTVWLLASPLQMDAYRESVRRLNRR